MTSPAKRSPEHIGQATRAGVGEPVSRQSDRAAVGISEWLAMR